jgi:GTPase
MNLRIPGFGPKRRSPSTTRALAQIRVSRRKKTKDAIVKLDVEDAEESAPIEMHDSGTHHVDGYVIGTRALVLVPQPPRGRRFEDSRRKGNAQPALPPLHSADDRRDEAIGLAQAIDLLVIGAHVIPLASPKPATLFGSGKVDEIKAMVAADKITLCVVDHPLSPIQQRNLEKAWMCKVLDRTGLILEIFGRRAQTREGRLQVELAHLTYQKSRLVRAWTHLERQRGGAGFLGGPGESQLELDRRMIEDKIVVLKVEIKDVVRTREINRATRKKVPYKIVAIVGYTNAGKSTLFNRITGASVFAKDQVFATLDPTMREVKVAPGRKIILSDTVGFISDLPTMLVAAFRATLEEVIEASLILHVRDISHPESDAQALDVRSVLRDLGVDPDDAKTKMLEVWNKMDRVSAERREELMAEVARRKEKPVLVSAITGEGVDVLLATINDNLGADDDELSVTLGPAAGKLLHWLHEHAEIVEKKTAKDGKTKMRVKISAEKRGRLEHQAKEAGAKIGK